MWFLGSYCFTDAARYSNKIFLSRLDWMLGYTGLNLNQEFPGLLRNSGKRNDAIAFACSINYNFFSRKGMEVPDTKVDKKYIVRYNSIKHLIRRISYATGPDKTAASVPAVARVPGGLISPANLAQI